MDDLQVEVRSGRRWTAVNGGERRLCTAMVDKKMMEVEDREIADNDDDQEHDNNCMHACIDDGDKQDTHEQEIKNLRNTVKILKDRENNLEIELLEYYGLKEQETAVMELQNRLKLNNMEAKLYALKIESLQTDNRRLEAQMVDYKKVVADLEAARTKIKMLKKKIKSESEQILNYQQQVQKLQENESKIVSESEQNKKQILDYQQQVQRMQEDEQKIVSEVEQLRKLNHDLQLENTDLADRLDSVQILATSVLEDGEVRRSILLLLTNAEKMLLPLVEKADPRLCYLESFDVATWSSQLATSQTEKVKEESQTLKKQNEDLSKENEQLQSDRCADVEELVYLRWINACLRYELRNYRPAHGKTTAKDLSKKLSPKSEDKAKQLIVEYADKEGGINSEQWSISQANIITDSGEFDESFIDDQLRHKNNNNTFFGKLMRVIRGKESHNNSPNHHRNHSRSSSVGKSESGGEDVVSCSKTSPGGSKRLTHRHSDSSFYQQVESGGDGGGGGGGGGSGRRRRSCSSGGHKSDLAKYAEALKDSRPKPNFKSHKSSPTLCFF
ncbi:hypothetical protein QVD17_11092 [Tagetes erecta]|uniref:Protein CHUP1, chloroplastic n=1 Tax=Tagetes erecta TaxID=13708 RepID=A0AAD8L418_TARER|nr:hypothetical protein QVD17_11092 [Tagetes erecta]